MTELVPVAATLSRPEGLRRYLVAASPAAPAGGRPLVLVLHGAGASADQVLGLAFPPSPLAVWLDIAAREQLVVIAPDAGKGGWSDCFASEERVARKNDVGFIDALIEHAVSDYNVDPERVYVMGVSRGGWMAYAVAAALPQKLAAFSVVLAGMPPPGRTNPPATPLSALIFGCTADPLIRYDGGKHWYVFGAAEPVRSIEDTAHAWRQLADLPDAPEVVQLSASVTRFLWGSAPDRLQVGLYRISGAGHAEPSRLKRYPRFINWLTGSQNADIEVAEAAWEFFHQKRLTRDAVKAVRRYTAQDLQAVCRIYLDAKPDELRFEPATFDITPLEQDAKILAAFEESDVLVYEDEGILGFAATYQGQLRAMFVLRSARGQGVGQALLDAVLAREPNGVSLNVARSNTGAIRFYEKNGFSVVGETVNNYDGVPVRYLQMQARRAPGMITVRYTSEADWQELKRIRLAALLDAPTAFGVSYASAAAYTDASWQDRAAGRGPARFMLALDGGRAVGIVAHVPAAADLSLIAMWVAPGSRGTPAATQLVQAVQAHAIAEARARVVLEVSPDNQRAAAFYRRLEFNFLPEWEPLESHPHIQLQKMAWKPET